MHLLGVLLLVIQIAFSWNVVRRGHNLLWILVIFLVPVFGCLLYALLVLMPEAAAAGGHRRRRRRSRRVPTWRPQPDPWRHGQQARLPEPVSGEIDAAREALARGAAREAVSLFRQGILDERGAPPEVLQDYAAALFACDQPRRAREVLDTLTRENPHYVSEEGHLLYARVLEAAGDVAAALGEYRSLATYYRGAQAKTRLGLLLEREGRGDEAARVFRDVLAGAGLASPEALEQNREWIAIARDRLDARGGEDA